MNALKTRADLFCGIPGLARAKSLVKADALWPASHSGWNRNGLSGRLVEVCGQDAKAALTAAFGLLLDAQRQGEPVAWVTSPNSFFFPPDAAQSGVDLSALVIVRVPDLTAALKVADKLARSGAFGLLIVDLEEPEALNAKESKAARRPLVPAPLQSRLLGLAQKHDLALVFLSGQSPHGPSLGSLFSLRALARLMPEAQGRFKVEVQILKDKRRAPCWQHEELCDGPSGLR